MANEIDKNKEKITVVQKIDEKRSLAKDIVEKNQEKIKNLRVEVAVKLENLKKKKEENEKLNIENKEENIQATQKIAVNKDKDIERKENNKKSARDILSEKIASMQKAYDNSQKIDITNIKKAQWETKKVDQDQYQRKPFDRRRNFDSKKPQSNQNSTNMLEVANSVNTNNDQGISKDKSRDIKKKKFEKQDKEKTISKKDIIKRKTNIYSSSRYEDYDEDGIELNAKVKKSKKKQTKKVFENIIEKAVVNTEIIPIKTLSEKIGQTATSIVSKLFNLNKNVDINGSIDYETAEYIAMEFGTELELQLNKTAEDKVLEILETNYDDKDLEIRPPVVTIMGHVDHGKTSLLDYIRDAHVAQGEAGGITQHIGAYTINVNDRKITFIDTPGHEAFTTMRKRGATVTDIAVIVVAVNDGIMPQTIEAISHAKEAGVSIIVAANKIDIAPYNKEKIASELANYGLLSEAWGGDVVICPVSAKTGEGVDNLLENIILVSDILELKAPKNCDAQGTIIEAKVDKGSGPVATILIKSGTLKIGDVILAGTVSGKVKAMRDESGRNIKEAGPSEAVAILGFSEVPEAGDSMIVLKDEKIARQVAQERINKVKEQQEKFKGPKTLEELARAAQEQEQKSLSVILKCDVQGSVEAVRQSLEALETEGDEKIRVKIVHAAVGAVNESDISLAETSNSIVLAYNIKPDAKARKAAENTGIEIREYKVIYSMIEDIEKALKGMLEPKFEENIIGHAEVLETFKITGVGTIAGSKVLDGKILRNAKARLIRDNIVIYDTTISSLKREKNDAKEVAKGFECGIGLNNFNDIKAGDIIEVYQMDEVNE